MSNQCEMKILSLQAFDILETFKHSLISALLKKNKKHAINNYNSQLFEKF